MKPRSVIVLALGIAFLLAAAPPARADEVDEAVAEAFELLKAGKGKEARERLTPIAAAHPNSAQVQYGLAQAAVLERSLTTARKHLEKTVELDSEHIDARLVLATIHRVEKRPKDARKQLEAVLERDGAHAAALEGMGDLERDAKQWAKAAGFYEMALAARPGVPKLIGLIATVWSEAAEASRDNKKKRDEYGAKAIEAYRRLLEAYPDGIEAHYNLGTIALLCERYDEAAEALEKYIEKKPAEARAVYNLAQVREKQARSADALELWKRFVDLAKDDKVMKGQIPHARDRIKALEKEQKKSGK